MEVLTLENISKSYGKHSVLKEIDLTLKKGIYGLVGSNGAGKTTLIKIIAGLLDADSGAITYNQKFIGNKEYRSSIGFMPQSSRGYDNFTGKQLLWYIASLKNWIKMLRKIK